MTGKDRILTVLDRKQPDRIPTLEWDFYPDVIKAVADAESDIEFVQTMDLDGIAIWPDRRITAIDDKHFIDDFGVTRVYSDEYPVPVAHPLDAPKKFNTYQMPSPDDDRIWRSVQTALDQIGKEKCVIARVRDVVSFPRDVMGYQNFLMSFYLEPEFVADLMEMSVEYSTKVVKNLKGIGVEVVAMLDDIANAQAPLFSPAMYREHILPHFAKLVLNCHNIGVKVIKHSDGNLNPILEDLIGSGIDCLDPIDPMGNMDMAHIKATYGDQIAMKGNIDCVQTLVTGSHKQIEDEIKACMFAGGIGGGLIISSSNSIHKGVNPDCYKYMLECIKRYGNYPLIF